MGLSDSVRLKCKLLTWLDSNVDKYWLHIIYISTFLTGNTKNDLSLRCLMLLRPLLVAPTQLYHL